MCLDNIREITEIILLISIRQNIYEHGATKQIISFSEEMDTMEKGGDYDLSFQCPAISPTARGNLEVKTLLFAPPFAKENLPGVRILMSKPCHFPCNAGTLEK